MQSYKHLNPILSDIWRLHPARMAEEITGGTFVRYPHIEKISQLVAKAIFKGGARIILSAPPRHGKSFLMSRWVPAWFLSHWPERNVILASYEAAFAASWGRQVRNILAENPRLGVKIADDSHAADRWHTSVGGGMFTAGCGGPLVGRGGQLLLIDDYCKNAEEADSPTYQRRAVEWWNTTFRTRAEPGASIIILATRWHQSDLIGYLTSIENESRNEWTVINLSAVAESIDDFMGRAVGEPLCPDRFDLRALEDIHKSVGPRAWSALYQGTPTPTTGGLFTSEMFDVVDLPANFDYRFIMADTAYNDKQENDFTVFTAFGVLNKELYILDVFRKQIKAVDVEVPLIMFIKRFSTHGFRGAFIEPKGHGIYLNQSLPPKGVWLPGESQAKDFYQDRRLDKVARANNAVPHLAYKKVHFNRSIANREELLAEVLNFPRGRFDDFCDTLIDGIKYAFATTPSVFDYYRRKL